MVRVHQGPPFLFAGMAELADALDLGSSVIDVQVQLLLPAPLKNLVELWFNLLIISILEMELIFCCGKEKVDLMVNIIKQEIDIKEALKKKLEFICSFCNAKCEIQKGSIRTIERTNLSYLEVVLV